MDTDKEVGKKRNGCGDSITYAQLALDVKNLSTKTAEEQPADCARLSFGINTLAVHFFHFAANFVRVRVNILT